MCKKIGHGKNYRGGDAEIAQQTRLSIDVIAEFGERYYRQFPGIPQWHTWVQNELKTRRQLTTLTGRRRYFFKRPSDKKLLKEAIAYDPQGSLADIVNRALLKLWRMNIAIIMFQDHDALTFMYPERDEERILPVLRQHLTVPIPLAHNRTLTIPYDCEVGWNKGHYCCGEMKPECKSRGCHGKENRDGLRGYDGPDDRRRQPQAGILDRVVHRSDWKFRFTPDLPAVDGDLDSGSSSDAEGLVEDIE